MFGAAIGSYFITSGFGDAAGGLFVNTEHAEDDDGGNPYDGDETGTF